MNFSGKTIIYKNLKEIVDPIHTALAVIDVQNTLVDSIYNREEFLHNLKVFLQHARNNNIPVIYCRVTIPPKAYLSSWRAYNLMTRFGVDSLEKLPKFFDLNNPESEINAEVAPMKDEVVIAKTTTSIFVGTNFESLMRNRGIKTILFTGIATEVGVDSSARDASDLGFYTVVVQNCVSTRDTKEMNEWALKILKKVCLVVPSKEIMAEW
jgi:nicotinamidase-related amidase